MALSKTTRDHDEIRKWAEARGAVPAEVSGTERGNQTGILRFEFPHAPNRNDSKLQEISWDDFFEKFDENDLELVYQDKTADGEQSNFNKLIHPDSEEHSRHSGKSASGSHSGSHSGASHTTASHGTGKSHSESHAKSGSGAFSEGESSSSESKSSSKKSASAKSPRSKKHEAA